ncbi:MAG: hypothetical protein HUU20_11945 [Pirellulales bacterium]|nr:hypothetical protein [Pirellulales bacterium]
MAGIRFWVEEIHSPNKIVGRNDVEDIPVGTVFGFVKKTRINGARDERGELVSVDLGVVASVSFRLTAVEYYRHCLDFVPSGHTARITVDGSGFETIAALLNERRAHEHFCLTEQES